MADEQGANGNGGANASGSQPGNNAQGAGDGNNAAGGGQSGAQTPFHEDPKVQEYINRQVEKRVEAVIANLNIPQPGAQTVAKADEIVEMLKRELNLKDEDAAIFAKVVSAIADKRVKESVAPLEEVRSRINVSDKIAAFARQNPDIADYQKEMAEIFNKLKPEDQKAILTMDGGIGMLYSQAKLKAQQAGTQSERDRARQDSQPGSGGSARMASGNPLAAKAAAALQKGDRVEYAKIIAEIQKGGR